MSCSGGGTRVGHVLLRKKGKEHFHLVAVQAVVGIEENKKNITTGKGPIRHLHHHHHHTLRDQ
jgi:hypothetical protein